jgi:ABC-type transport system involved in multi-copper enzyme maturation permease subunit
MRLRMLGLSMMLEQPEGGPNSRSTANKPLAWMKSFLKPFESRPKPAGPEEWKALARDYLLSVPGFEAVDFKAIDSAKGEQPERIEVEADINWAELPYSHRIGFLFGVWKADLDEQPLGEAVVLWIQRPLVGWIAGWAGIIIAVVVTAGFVPNMLRKGTIDFLIVKPISRPALLLYKYLGGLTFVLLNAVVLVTATWIAFGLTTGNWSPWYLASIFVLGFYFAILYSMSTLVGVLTRSQLAAILITIGCWFLLWIVNQAYTAIHFPAFEKKIMEEAPVVISIVDTIHMILPQPSALGVLNDSLLLQANGSKDFAHVYKLALAKFSWAETLTTSAAFIAVMLGLACWRFSRKDY